MSKSSDEEKQKRHAISKRETLIHVLHVDDDADFLKCSSQILGMHGPFQIENASSVEDALKKLEQKTYDAIVADYQMPKRSGLDLLKELRKRGNDVPFILFTGKGREEVAIEALNLGADRYFNKNGKTKTVYGELSHSIIAAVNAERAETALQESEEKYRKQFEESMDSLVLADAETGIIIDCNRALTRLVGRTKSELVGKPQRILHPSTEITGDFSKTFEQHLKEKEGQVLEAQVITKTGEIRDVAIKANIFEMKGRRIIQGIFRDITEQKKTEEQLRRERETLELVTANIGAGLSIISKDYKILWANKFLKNVFGDVEGKTCYLIYNDHGKICPGCGVKEIFETGKNNVVLEQSVPGPGGQRIWIEITANPIRDENGNIVAVSELAVFVDERKKLENKLREAEERYHVLFNKAPLGILIMDSTGTAVEFNEEAHHQLGYSREEFAKLTVSDYEVMETPEEIRARMDKILKTGKDVFESKHRTKTGELRDIKNTVQIIELAGKKFFHIITQDITEQKKAEESLRASEQKHRSLLNGMNDTAWVIDSDCSFIDVNDAAVKALGYSREELLSMKIFDIDFNLDPKKIENLVEAMPKDTIQVFQTEHTTKSGKSIPVEISSSLITYKGKQAVLSIARDITERIKVREELRQSKEKYRVVFENTGTAMCILEEDKTISMINRRFEELSGYSREEAEGTKWTKFVPEKHLKRMEGYHEARRKKGIKVPSQYTFDFVAKGGQTKYCMVTVSLIPGTRKTIVAILDITDRKKAAEKLRASEERFRSLFDNAPDAIWLQDASGIFVDGNKMAEDITGYNRDELIGKSILQLNLIPEKYVPFVLDAMATIQVGERSDQMGLELMRKDGSLVSVEVSAIPVERDGKIEVIGIARDITDRKEAEEKLEEMMNRLVSINEKLGVVGKLTRHDARNKLSVIANNVYLAKQKLPANHISVEFLDDAETAVDQMEAIFSFSRNYEMLGVEELSYIDVRKCVEEAAILLSGMNDVKLVNECRGLKVMADSLLRQLFYNLIDDTLKYGENVTQIRVYYKEEKDCLKLFYEDDGVGIPEDEKEVIFQEGYGKGTGYGLYLIKKMCKEYGWTIRETGKHGKGAQFTITIPKTTKKGKVFYRLGNK